MTDERYRLCRYNTSKNTNFVGYCDHPQYYTDTGHRLVECKGCPCNEYQQREEEEDNTDDW